MPAVPETRPDIMGVIPDCLAEILDADLDPLLDLGADLDLLLTGFFPTIRDVLLRNG